MTRQRRIAGVFVTQGQPTDRSETSEHSLEVRTDFGISRQITAAACYRRLSVVSSGVARKHFTCDVNVGPPGKQKRRKQHVDDVEQMRNVASIIIHFSSRL